MSDITQRRGVSLKIVLDLVKHWVVAADYKCGVVAELAKILERLHES